MATCAPFHAIGSRSRQAPDPLGGTRKVDRGSHCWTARATETARSRRPAHPGEAPPRTRSRRAREGFGRAGRCCRSGRSSACCCCLRTRWRCCTRSVFCEKVRSRFRLRLFRAAFFLSHLRLTSTTLRLAVLSRLLPQLAPKPASRREEADRQPSARVPRPAMYVPVHSFSAPRSVHRAHGCRLDR